MAVREAKCALHSAPIGSIDAEQCKYFERKVKIFDKIAALLASYSRCKKEEKE